jgi:hypothetical protein
MANKYFPQIRKRSSNKILLILLLVILFFIPSDGLGFLTCPLHYFFCIPCPLCGMTRSIVSLLHLELSNCFMYHPLGPFILFIILINIFMKEPQNTLIKIRSFNKTLYHLTSIESFYGLFILVWLLRFFLI